MEKKQSAPAPGSKVEKILSLWNEGKSHNEIAAQLNCPVQHSHSAVWFWRRRGYPLRDKKPMHSTDPSAAHVPEQSELRGVSRRVVKETPVQPKPEIAHAPKEALSASLLTQRVIDGLCALNAEAATPVQIARLQAWAMLIQEDAQ